MGICGELFWGAPPHLSQKNLLCLLSLENLRFRNADTSYPSIIQEQYQKIQEKIGRFRADCCDFFNIFMNLLVKSQMEGIVATIFRLFILPHRNSISQYSIKVTTKPSPVMA